MATARTNRMVINAFLVVVLVTASWSVGSVEDQLGGLKDAFGGTAARGAVSGAKGAVGGVSGHL